MTSVLHLPRAEQYPSRTATSWSPASNLISGMSGSLFLANLLVERDQRVTPRPLRLNDFSIYQFGQRTSRNANFSGDLLLRHAGGFYVSH